MNFIKNKGALTYIHRQEGYEELVWDLHGFLSLAVYDLIIFLAEVKIMKGLFWNKMVNLFQ